MGKAAFLFLIFFKRGNMTLSVNSASQFKEHKEYEEKGWMLKLENIQ